MRPRDSRPGIRSSAFWVVAALLFVAAMGLRYWGLGRASLWLDEILQLNCTTLPLKQMWQCFPADKPPLDYAIQWLFLRGGDGERTARFHACLFGSILVPIMALFGRRLAPQTSFSITLGLVALANPLLIRFSQEGRPYALMLLAETLFLAALWKIVQGMWRGRPARVGATESKLECCTRVGCPRHVLALGATLLLCLWTHYLALFGAVVALVLAAGIWCVERPKVFTRRDAALAAGVLAAVALAALPLWLRAQGKAPSEFNAPFHPDSLKMTGQYLDIYTMGYEWWMRLEGARWLFAALALTGWIGWAMSDRRAAAHFCGLHFLICFFGPFLAYWKANHWMEMRYTLAALPTALALMAMGLDVLGRGVAKALRKPDAKLCGAVLASILLVANIAYVVAHPFLRSDWRALGKRLEREARPDAVVVVGESFNRYGVEYYLRRRGLQIPVVVAASDPQVLRRLRDEGRDVWSVVEGYAVPPAFTAEREKMAPLKPPIYGVDVRR